MAVQPMRTTLPASTNPASGASGARPAAPERSADAPAAQRDSSAASAVPSGEYASAPVRRVLPRWDNQTQGNVARAQQALDYLERVASELENVKSDLAARISGHQNNARQLEARLRQLGATLDARGNSAGGGVDAQLDFKAAQPAAQRFRIRGFEMDSLLAAAPQTLAFSVGGLGGPQLSLAIEPGMTRAEVAKGLDRTLAPVKIRTSLDTKGELLFSTPETAWPAVRDSIAVSGRGRVATEAQAQPLAPQDWDTGNPDALRQSLREVVQALARVRRSQEAASAALSAATMEAARAQAPLAEAALLANDFAATAANPDYESLLAITSALVGVSRERVQALLGLR
jgi:hypothetical protein